MVRNIIVSLQCSEPTNPGGLSADALHDAGRKALEDYTGNLDRLLEAYFAVMIKREGSAGYFTKTIAPSCMGTLEARAEALLCYPRAVAALVGHLDPSEEDDCPTFLSQLLVYELWAAIPPVHIMAMDLWLEGLDPTGSWVKQAMSLRVLPEEVELDLDVVTRPVDLHLDVAADARRFLSLCAQFMERLMLIESYDRYQPQMDIQRAVASSSDLGPREAHG